jgi:hypothetical protein
MGGALGFYGFSSVGADLVEYSRTLTDGEPLSLEAFDKSREFFLNSLNSELKKIEGGTNG